ncbi:hypothetical protein [Bacteroides sp. 51]|uniref:hypothetical protein n=1 Tax=Bacteroides sp. 51 TaxID=2302938 RepID=UPI0013D30D86|nr:hypothetical protein [Bacteroides sp. 51]NDV83850.1 hypothetical protein [Bacteroides sp. 51]
MKVYPILATALVAILMFVSCSKHDYAPVHNTNESKSFFIQIGKHNVTSRAEGADMSDKTVTFSDGYLIFTSGDEIGQVIKIVSTTAGDGEVTVSDLKTGAIIEGIPASTKNVYLYGNLGSSISGIASVARKGGSLASIEALTWTLSDIQNAANDVAKVPVYGKGDVVPGVSNPDRLESKFDVAPIGCRLQIGEISCSDSRVSKLTLAGIYINSFYHSMDAGFTLTPGDLVDKGINKSKYPAGGYTDYPTMSDILTPVDLKAGAATPATTDNYWAYNFLPTSMPHIVLHFTSLEVGGQESPTDKYATVAQYSTSSSGGAGNQFSTAKSGNVYTLNIDISDYEKQVTDLPESGSTVMGYVEIKIIDWKANTLYPEW